MSLIDCCRFASRIAWRGCGVGLLCLVALLAFTPVAMAQEPAEASIVPVAPHLAVSARVVDADTGEPLPLVGVYVSAETNTLSNFDGEFSLTAPPDAEVRFTCIGRSTLTFKASALPPVIRMPMLAKTMSEVTVVSLENLLVKLAKKMEKGFQRHRTDNAFYFYRQTSVMGGKQDIVEAFTNAQSAVNLRNVEFVSGRHGALSRQRWEQSALRNMNLHHIIELGPMTLQVPFWNRLVTPLLPDPFPTVRGQRGGKSFSLNSYTHSAISSLQTIYHITADELSDGDEQLLAIHLRLRDGVKLEQPVMTGTLYVNQRELQVLAFDGQVENMQIQVRRSELQGVINIPVAMKFHIDYRYDRKYAEVADLSMDTSWEIQGADNRELPLLAQLNHFQTRTLLFNVERQKRLRRGKSRGYRVSENMLAAVAEAGYDSTLWANTDVVKRTAEEEAIASGTLDREQQLRDSLNTYISSLEPLARLVDRQQRFGRLIPQEKVYVHMDNTGYFLGDTIWFAAYLRKTNTDTPSRMSRVLYAELWNHDGYLVERKLIEMTDGRGHGFFALPDTLYSGYFELRAYTRWQLNWGQTEHPHNWGTEYRFFNKAMAKDFFRDYEKLYSRVFPVYDKPKTPGDFYKDMTFRPLRRYFKTEPKAPELRISLFPEGGNLVAGVPCRVAFEAATEEGEVREGTLQLMAGQQVVATASTVNRGRGTFSFTPQAGQKYEAVFRDQRWHELQKAAAASAARAERRALQQNMEKHEVRQDIKGVEPEGVALQVDLDTLSGTWQFRIAACGKAASQPLGITVMNEGRLEQYWELNNPQPSADFHLPASALAAGVNQVTVFDSIGHIYADRLFFVTRPDLTQHTLQFTGLKSQYQPFEPIDFDVTAADVLPDMTISLAVRDAVHTDNTFDSGNIMTEMLLSSEIKGFVPQPDYFFERDDAEHRTALDLLMLTQGWRRFNWQEQAVPGAWDLTHPAEYTQMVSGTVHRYSTLDLELQLGLLANVNDLEREYYEHYSYGRTNYARGTPIVGYGESYVSQLMSQDEAANRFSRPRFRFLSANEYTTDSYINLQDVYQSRSRLGVIADTHNGIYGLYGREWGNADYNVLRFKTDRHYRQLQRDRMHKTARQYVEEGNLKHDVTVHAEFVNPFDTKNVLVGEAMTQNGRFLIDLPRFTGQCYFHLAAADTTQWKAKRARLRLRKGLKEDKTAWVRLQTMSADDWPMPRGFMTSDGSSGMGGGGMTEPITIAGKMPDLPDFYVRINFPYPRWIKPYTYYQVHNAPLHEGRLPSSLQTDGVRLLDQVTIRARHGGLRRLDYSKPAYVLDAHEAANLGIDAGMSQYAYLAGDAARDAAMVLVGDMGMSRHFEYSVSIDQKGPGYWWDNYQQQRNGLLCTFDKFYIYTDYSPRREGDERFEQANQPEVRVDMRRNPEGEDRAVFINRHMVLDGFAYQEDFYHPDYKRNPPVEGQKDYRRTLYWNPELKLNDRGQAHVHLFNNSQTTSVLLEAEGLNSEGGLMWGR